VFDVNGVEVSKGKKATSNCGVCYGPEGPDVITRGEAKARRYPIFHTSQNKGDWAQIDLGGDY